MGDESDDVARRLRAGDTAAAAEPFERCRDRLGRMVRLRLGRRLRGRLESPDVLQEACHET